MAPEPAHGLLTTYVHRRCRCERCRAASRAYCRNRSRLRAYGRSPSLVPVEVVAAHIRLLAAHGIGWEQIGDLAGVGRTTVSEIAHPAGRRRGVTPAVAGAILRVRPSLDNAADSALVPAAGTRRRLQALMLAGHTLTGIAAAIGSSSLGRVLTRDRITARIARGVRDYYHTHWDLPPHLSTPTQRAMAARTRARAARAGFLPALAWDDDTLDDPAAAPDRAALRMPARQVRVHLEDVEYLAVLGAAWEEVQARTGACRRTVERSCLRSARPDLVHRITSNRWAAA
jgi:hypothetical protein